jgi:hypothetical protein
MKDLKTIILSVLALLFFIMYLFTKCNNGKYVQQKSDTVKTIDTFYITSEAVVKYVPKPYKVEVPTIDTFYLEDTSKQGYKDAYFKCQYQLLTKSYYNDTLFINDSTGLTGFINVQDTVYKNRLGNRTITRNITFPKIVETITITEQEKRKILWFVGGGILGNEIKYVNGVDLNLGFLNKKHQFYEVGYQRWGNDNIYRIGTKIKL